MVREFYAIFMSLLEIWSFFLIYIQRDGDDKEPEMQIGFPTDVKHVAHIGWDGPSVSSPSWMNEYKGPKEGLSDMLNTTVDAQENSTKSKKDKAKSSTKHHQSMNSSSPVNSPTRRSKHNRSLMDSPTKGSPGRSARQSKKNQNSGLGNVVAVSQDQQVVSSPKKSRRRKSKGGSGSGSVQGLVTTSEEKKERD